MTEVNLMLGDCLDRLKELDDDSVDSIVTDPPYGLSFMGKAWDKSVPSQEVWEECLRVLKPGGHLLAFAGTRTQHRMAVAIEDAGFEIRDMIAWVYGSGFPKSQNISKAIDKAAGATREVVGKRQHPTLKDKSKIDRQSQTQYHANNTIKDEWDVTVPATDEAKQWDGWGTALKPALEPITVARKPIDEKTVAANVLKHGTGGINIDASRVETDENTARTQRGVTMQAVTPLQKMVLPAAMTKAGSPPTSFTMVVMKCWICFRIQRAVLQFEKWWRQYLWGRKSETCHG